MHQARISVAEFIVYFFKRQVLFSLFTQCSSADTEHSPILCDVSFCVESLKLHAVRMVGKEVLGFQMIVVRGSSNTSRIALSVICPFPVAARLRRRVTSKRTAFGLRSKKRVAALRGAWYDCSTGRSRYGIVLSELSL